MNNFLKNNLVYLLAFAAIIFAVVVLFLGLRTPRSSTPPEPVESFEPSPGPTVIESEIMPISANLRGQLFQVIDPLIISFSQPLDVDSLKVDVKPEKAIKKIQLSPTSVSIEPDEVWDFDTIYKVTIEELSEKNYEFSFQTEEHKGI